MDRKKVGLVERVTLVGRSGQIKEVLARIDTGARSSSLDLSLAQDIGCIITGKTKTVFSASGRTVRALAEVKLIIHGREIETEMTIIDRSHMNYPLLIGREILTKQGFIIDPLEHRASSEVDPWDASKLKKQGAKK